MIIKWTFQLETVSMVVLPCSLSTICDVMVSSSALQVFFVFVCFRGMLIAFQSPPSHQLDIVE